MGVVAGSCGGFGTKVPLLFWSFISLLVSHLSITWDISNHTKGFRKQEAS